MTEQDVIKRLYQVFIVEGADKSRDDISGLCVYRHLPEQNKFGCAIGCLLPADIAQHLDKVWLSSIGDNGIQCTSIASFLTVPIGQFKKCNTPEVFAAILYVRETFKDIRSETLRSWQSDHDNHSIYEFRTMVQQAYDRLVV